MTVQLTVGGLTRAELIRPVMPIWEFYVHASSSNEPSWAQYKNGFKWHKMTRLRRRFSAEFQASATTTAASSLSHSSPIWSSEMMKGGAISTWSPRRPSIVPPIG